MLLFITTNKDHDREPYRRLIGGSLENEVDKSEGYIPQVLKTPANKYELLIHRTFIHSTAPLSTTCSTVDTYVPASTVATTDATREKTATPSYIPKVLTSLVTARYVRRSGSHPV